ncbi:MAG: PIN domain-containing protein [Bacteroidetes bacterium]|nr:PIN domain-containing protein [Bacteroidota bacterium]
MPERVLFAVNVLLDVIENRLPYVNQSGPALRLVSDGKVRGLIAASSVDTLAFLIRKNATSAQTHSILEDLLLLLEVAPVDGDIVRKALSMRWNDPEDAIIYQAAKFSGCTAIVTRNTRDFRVDADSIEVLSPEQLVRRG